jgi:hypothetical protein
VLCKQLLRSSLFYAKPVLSQRQRLIILLCEPYYITCSCIEKKEENSTNRHFVVMRVTFVVSWPQVARFHSLKEQKELNWMCGK